MSASTEQSSATIRLETGGDSLRLVVGGAWKITGGCERWEAPGDTKASKLLVRFEALVSWDSSLALYLASVRDWCRARNTPFELENPPTALASLLGQYEAASTQPIAKDRAQDLFSFVGLRAQGIWAQVFDISHFVGECVLGLLRVARKPVSFRWRDLLSEMQACGALALPIVGLVSFLVGITLAYTGAIILRLFGGDIWVADLVGLSITREMGAMMTAVVLAGRTGAAYAAHLGNMQANEEVDALQTLGVNPVEFLVLPRMLALAVMTPLLALYANFLGILGGMLIALSILEIPPTAYWIEMLSIVDLSDICTGLIKASTFGLIIGMCGCMRGLQAERSAAGVGKAATSAVVTAILLMVVADAIFAVVFNILGW